jgi:hypothetical protein
VKYRNRPTTHTHIIILDKDAIASRNTTTIFLDKAGKAKAQAEEFEPSEATKRMKRSKEREREVKESVERER